MKKILSVFLVLLVCACSIRRSPVTHQNLYENDAERYLKNIVVKQKSEDKIVYEYKDVRIDELSNAAAKYCNQFGKRAVLEHTALFRNNNMRATFDCTVLQ